MDNLINTTEALFCLYFFTIFHYGIKCNGVFSSIVYNHDLYHIVESTIKIAGESDVKDQLYDLIDIQVVSNNILPSTSVKIKKGLEEFKSIIGFSLKTVVFEKEPNFFSFVLKKEDYLIGAVVHGFSSTIKTFSINLQ